MSTTGHTCEVWTDEIMQVSNRLKKNCIAQLGSHLETLTHLVIVSESSPDEYLALCEVMRAYYRILYQRTQHVQHLQSCWFNIQCMLLRLDVSLPIC